MRPLPEPSFDLAELVGRLPEDAKHRCEADGFVVQVVDLDWLEAHNKGRTPMTADLRVNRIRLMVRSGRVISARQG